MRKQIVLAVSLLIFSVLFVTAASALPPPLERRIFIHRGYGKGGKRPKPPKDGHPSHYDLLGKGVKWKTLPVAYVIDPDNPDGLTEAFIVQAFSLAAEEWDAHTGEELFGSHTIDYKASWDSEMYDGRNELVFGDYPAANVIAVTVIWGYFSGPPGQREIIEFDILFDTDFTWGDAASDQTVMDLQNIAAHELGHGAGLDDIYNCNQETMYGYATEGEITKRNLFDGDIAGIQKLYGA